MGRKRDRSLTENSDSLQSPWTQHGGGGGGNPIPFSQSFQVAQLAVGGGGSLLLQKTQEAAWGYQALSTYK